MDRLANSVYRPVFVAVFHNLQNVAILVSFFCKLVYLLPILDFELGNVKLSLLSHEVDILGGYVPVNIYL